MEGAGQDLAAACWTDLDPRTGAVAPLLAVPVGACEQHGPHLPLGTDTLVATTLARALAAHRRDVAVTPPLAITASGEHAGFPGTLSIGTSVMTSVVIELVRSADWAGGVVLVNGHGGNRAAIDEAVTRLRAEARDVLAWWPTIVGGDPHAGHTETSLVLAISPDAVRSEAAVAGPVPTMGDLVTDGIAAHSATGVLGDPRGASAAHGRRLLDQLVADLVAAVARWRGAG